MINGKFTIEEKLKISIRTKEAMNNPKLRRYLSEKRKGISPWNKGLSTPSNGVLEHYTQTYGAWNKGLVGSKSGEKNGMWKGGLPKCTDCGKGLRNRKAKRCVTCNKNWQHRENLYNWKGGSKQSRISDYRYKQWARSVYKRDFFTCQMCLKHCGKDIQAHHIIPWIKDENLRFDSDNGITLCFKCHLKTRGKEYGYADLFKKIINLNLKECSFNHCCQRFICADEV